MYLSRQFFAFLACALYLCGALKYKGNMATIELRLSSKIQKETGQSEVLLRLFQGSKLNLRAKTGVFVSPVHFEYYIDRKKTLLLGVKVPDKAITITKEDAVKNHFIIFDRGEITVRNRLETDDKKFHDAAKGRIDAMKKFILDAYNNEDRDSVNSDWLQGMIDRFNYPEKYQAKEEQVKARSVFDLMEEYLIKKEFSYTQTKSFRTVMRTFARYESYIRFTDKNRKGLAFKADSVTRKDIENFRDYLKNEYLYADRYPELYGKLLRDYPVEITVKHKTAKLVERGNNTIIKQMKRLKAFFLWLIEKEYTKNRPFDGVCIGSEVYGSPIYITIAERDAIANYDLSAYPDLEVQRDIFVFQCLVGCRVGDLMRFTEGNISGGFLQYIPNKTHDEKPITARVPLLDKAKELIEKYRGWDKRGRLFPFIAPQNYNYAIKEVFTKCGITRDVIVRNPTTGEEEIKPLNEVASSHMARRTFVGGLYSKVQDPNLIGKMSGHVEGSRAFVRYRTIDDDLLKSVVSLID